MLQEARIIEWRLEKYSPLNKISYFLTSCKYQTLKLANFGLVSLEELEATKPIAVTEDFTRWYNLYIWELADILSKVNETLSEMFLMKVTYDISWSAMRKKRFRKLPVNEFWDNMKYIKFKVSDYVKDGKDSSFLQLLEV